MNWVTRILLLLIAAAPAAAQNLITNGSFDGGIAEWKATPGATIKWIPNPSGVGRGSLEVSAAGKCLDKLMWSKGLPPGAYQQVDFPGEGYYSWAWTWVHDATNPGSEARFYVCSPTAEEGYFAVVFAEEAKAEYYGGMLQPDARIFAASEPNAYVVLSPCLPDGKTNTMRFLNVQLTFNRPACSIYASPFKPLPTTAVVGQPVRFDGTFSTTCTAPVQHSWSFGDGEQSNDASPSHVYARAGTFRWSHGLTSGEESFYENGKIIVLSGVMPSANLFWKVFETEPDLGASPPNLGAVVYATPLAVGDPQFAEAAAGAVIDHAGQKALQLLLRVSLPPPLRIAGAIAEALELIDILADPTRVAPVGQNLAVVGSSTVKLDITPSNDQLSTWVAIDFVGTRFLPVDLTQIGQPLELEYQQQAGLLPKPIARVLLDAPDLARLANDSKRITYIVVPKTPVSIAEIPNGGLRIFQTSVVHYRVKAKVGSLFGASTTFEVHTGAPDLLTQLVSVGASQSSSITPTRPSGRKRVRASLQFETVAGKAESAADDGCTATLTVVDAVTRAQLVMRSVPADGIQNVDFGELPDRDWVLEISASCPRTVVVAIGFEDSPRGRLVRR